MPLMDTKTAFSPALLSLLLHRVGPAPDPVTDLTMTSADDVSTLFDKFVGKSTSSDRPRLPVIGRTSLSIDYQHWFQNFVNVDDTFGRTFFWGRVPVDRLVNFFREFRGADPYQLFVDLGTPIRVGGAGSSYDETCAKLLAKSAAGNPTVGAAIIDLGESSQGGPDDYGNHLRHAVTTNIEMSDHAEKVLSVLLERLDTNGTLPKTTISCALVRPPPTAIAVGSGALDQVNATELLDAVKALNTLLANESIPTVVNMSLGSHVGPHNGESPLEEYIANTIVQSTKRFLVASAGNDGGKGLSAKRVVEKDEPEYLRLRSGPRCHELLVEFWWEDDPAATPPATFFVQADVNQPGGAGSAASLGSVQIQSGTRGVLTAAPAGLPWGMTCYSLFSGQCHNNLSCIAFAITSGSSTALPQLEVTFTLKSAIEVVVNGWIVVAEVDPQTAFIEGGQEGTIMVPASDPSVVSVTGSENTGEFWRDSSRGPSASYRVGSNAVETPLMAHLVRLGGEAGTSFSSPRAVGDMAEVLANAKKRANCTNALSLVRETYGLKAWNPRGGYHKAIR